MKNHVVFLICAFFLLIVHSANAAWVTNYVAIHTGGTYNGTSWATAYTNIQTAISAAPASNVIHLAGHTFTLITPINVTNSFLTIRGGYEGTGAGPGNNDPARWPTVITRNASTNIRLMAISAVKDATLDKITFRNGRNLTSIYGGAIYAIAATNLSLLSCRFEGNGIIIFPDGLGGALYADSNSSGVISNSTFLGNYAASSAGHLADSKGGAIYLSGGTWTILDSLFRGNFTARDWGGVRNYVNAGAIWIQGGTIALKNLLMANNDSGAIYLNAGTITMDNLTVYGHDPYGISITASAAPGTTIRNSIIYGNRDDLAGSTPTLRHNCIGDGTSNGSYGNFSDDPLFEFPLFYLTTNSPCLNSGTGTVAEAGLTGTTSLTNSIADADPVNIGYHFPQGVVFETNLYVTTTGNDGNDGSGWADDKALRSITRALQLTRASAKINIAAGSYTTSTEVFPLTIEGKTVQLLGTNASATILNAATASKGVLQFISSPFGENKVRGLTLLNGLNLSVTAHGGGIHLRSSTLTVADSILQDNRTTSNPCYGGGVYAQDSTALFTDTIFLRNRAQHSAGHLDGHGGGFYAKSGSLLFQNLVFSTNWTQRSGTLSLAEGGGIRLVRGFFRLKNLVVKNNPGGGIYAQTSSGQTTAIENVTVYGNNLFGIRATAADATVKNSILWNNSNDTSGTVHVAYSCIGNGIGYTDGGGNTNVNPAFVDTNYFHLKSFDGNYVGGYFSGGTWGASASQSPLLDAGDPASDFMNEPSDNGGRINMGAYGNTTVASKSLRPRGTIIFVR